jgi:hypothetical protein
MDHREQAKLLLEDFNACTRAKPKHDAVDIQLEKDSVAKWAYHLNTQLAWGTENDIVEASHQLENRLKRLQEKLIMGILRDGPV